MLNYRGIPFTGYERWLADEGVPVATGASVADLRGLQMGPWKRLGGRAAYVDIDGMEGITGMWVAEIPPGERLQPEKHVYEEVFFALDGRGSMEAWQDQGAP